MSTNFNSRPPLGRNSSGFVVADVAADHAEDEDPDAKYGGPSDMAAAAEMSDHPSAGAGSRHGARSASSTTSSGGAPNSSAAATAQQSYKERRREAHTQAEQKRRDAIKKGYDYLQELMPSVAGEGASADGGAASSGLQPPSSPDDSKASAAGSAGKVSKATVLQKSIEYIQQIQLQKKKQDEELSQLKKEVVALQIMRTNYERLVKAQQASRNLGGGGQRSGQSGPGGSRPREEEVPVELKFEVFRMLMDSMFVSFNEKVSMRQFSELSACVFSWIEEQCKPALLQAQMQNILEEVRARHQESMGSGGTYPLTDPDCSSAQASGPHQSLQTQHQ